MMFLLKSVLTTFATVHRLKEPFTGRTDFVLGILIIFLLFLSRDMNVMPCLYI